MKYTRLGSSDLEISRIALGCMSLPPKLAEALPVIEAALDAGINLFDTADIYNDGLNESILGKAFEGRRSKVLIASKAGNVRRPDGGLDWNPKKKHIINAIEGTLRRLNTDYIDLYQLHGGTINDDIDETISTFEELKSAGKIRFYGISSIRPNVIREFAGRSSIVSVMMQYSILDTRPEEECLDLLRSKKIGVLARGSLAQGLLINKPAKAYLQHSEPDVTRAAQLVNDLSDAKRTPTQTALQYVLNNPAISSAVVGARTLQQLNEVVQTLETRVLTEDELTRFRKEIAKITYTDHR